MFDFWEIIGVHDLKFLDIEDAMSYAKNINKFVVIKKGNIEICGMFGADSIIDGRCPNGEIYSWSKAHRAGRIRRIK